MIFFPSSGKNIVASPSLIMFLKIILLSIFLGFWNNSNLFVAARKKKLQKCPLHAKKVSIAITTLKSQKECRFLSILVEVKDKDIPELGKAIAENTVRIHRTDDGF